MTQAEPNSALHKSQQNPGGEPIHGKHSCEQPQHTIRPTARSNLYFSVFFNLTTRLPPGPRHVS
jgi:hypothetical protein